jgi:hypothetical protein
MTGHDLRTSNFFSPLPPGSSLPKFLLNPPTQLHLLHPKEGRKLTPTRSEDRTLGGRAAILPRPAQRGEAGARSAPGEGTQGCKHGARRSVRADPLPPTFGRRPLPLRGRGDTAAAAAEEWQSLCRDATPAQDVRTKIWVRTSPPGEGPGVRVILSLGQTLKRRRCCATSPRHGFTSDSAPPPSPSPGGRGRSMRAVRSRPIPDAPVRTSRSVV